MFRPSYSTELVALFYVCVDVVFGTIACYVAALLHPDIADWTTLQIVLGENALSFLTVFIVWLAVGWTQGLFVSHRRDPLSYQMYLVGKSILLTLAASYVIVSFATGTPPEARFVLYYSLFGLLFVGGIRFLLCVALWFLRQRGFNPRHVVIVGANPRTANLVRALREHSRYGYHIVGVLDDEEERMQYFDDDLPYMGGFAAAEELLGEYVIDEMLVGLPVRGRYETIQELGDLCLGLGVSMRMVADLFPVQIARSRLHTVEGIPMLSLVSVSESAPQLALKRAGDFTGALLILLLISPLMIVVALLVKLSSRGPVFFLQERVGLNHRKFKMIKFRSMVHDAEDQKDHVMHMNEVDGPIFKIKDDPRITPVGRFIRRYSIDELPQLLNVVRGEMSLVGPRPHPTHEVAKYDWHQRRRLSVKPGMTGLSQVSGRSSLSWAECVELDLSYIDTWSIWMDTWILLRTVRAVASADGAT